MAHVKIWQEELARQLESLAERHSSEVASIAKELADRPVRVVERNLDQGTVDEALGQRDAAFRSRDLAYQALCEVSLIHRDRGSGYCRCGLRTDRCETLPLVTWRALGEWERKQVARKRAGQPHFLPQGHPALLDPRWEPSSA